MIAIIGAALPPTRLVELYIEFANIATALAIGAVVYALAWIGGRP